MSNNPIKYNDILGDIVKHNSIRDKIKTSLARVLNKDFRNEYRELKNSAETYLFKGSTDKTESEEFHYDGGNNLIISYSFRPHKSFGQGGNGGLFHETTHAIQFDNGEFGFAFNPTIQKWSVVNGDIWEEYQAWNTMSETRTFDNYKDWRSEKRKYGFDPRKTDSYAWKINDESGKIQFLRNRGYSESEAPLLQVYNSNAVKFKTQSLYALPHNKNAPAPNPNIPSIGQMPTQFPDPFDQEGTPIELKKNNIWDK
jgi:hypothetical protein